MLAHADDIADKPWLNDLLNIEEAERQRRSMARRLRHARIGSFKPLPDFDWTWEDRPTRHRRALHLGISRRRHTNAILVGPSGVGKSMILRNLAHHALIQGHTVRVTSASDMLTDLAAQEAPPHSADVCADTSCPSCYASTRSAISRTPTATPTCSSRLSRDDYDLQKPIVISTNKAFAEWSEVFLHAACTVTLVHRSEILEIEGNSYRLKEAKERAVQRSVTRKGKKSAA